MLTKLLKFFPQKKILKSSFAYYSRNRSQCLLDKKAIITASTDGIGFSIAQRFAEEGAHVVISSRKEVNVQKAICKLESQGFKKITGLVCHVGKAQDRKKLFTEISKLGGLDILVSNAAVNPSLAPVLECDEAAWDKIFDVNVKAAFLLAKDALPYLCNSKSGRIIFISSIGGLQPYEPFQNLGAYCVSKTALIGLCKAAACQLAPKNITVNCIAPGIVETKFSNLLVDSNEKLGNVLSRIPIGRLARPDDISSAAAFLASDEASYITGETLVVAGGMQSRL